MNDKERFRYLMAHPDYWTDKSIQQEAEELGKKIWNKEPAKKQKVIQVCMNNKIVVTGTSRELSKITGLSESDIREKARKQKTDRFGKQFKYLE